MQVWYCNMRKNALVMEGVQWRFTRSILGVACTFYGDRISRLVLYFSSSEERKVGLVKHMRFSRGMIEMLGYCFSPAGLFRTKVHSLRDWDKWDEWLRCWLARMLSTLKSLSYGLRLGRPDQRVVTSLEFTLPVEASSWLYSRQRSIVIWILRESRGMVLLQESDRKLKITHIEWRSKHGAGVIKDGWVKRGLTCSYFYLL